VTGIFPTFGFPASRAQRNKFGNATIFFKPIIRTGKTSWNQTGLSRQIVQTGKMREPVAVRAFALSEAVILPDAPRLVGRTNWVTVLGLRARDGAIGTLTFSFIKK